MTRGDFSPCAPPSGKPRQRLQNEGSSKIAHPAPSVEQAPHPQARVQVQGRHGGDRGPQDDPGKPLAIAWVFSPPADGALVHLLTPSTIGSWSASTPLTPQPWP